MKRYLALAITCIFLFSSLATPASAAETESFSSLVDLLDYGFSLENDTNTIGFANSTQVELSYLLHSRIAISYVDVLFSYASNDTVDVSLMDGSTVKADLTVVKVSGNIYRAYGSFKSYYEEVFTLRFTTDTATTNRVTIHSFEVGRMDLIRTDIEGWLDINATNYSGQIHYVPTDATNQRSWVPTLGSEGTFYLYLFVEEWQAYDYIDFMINIYCDDITSINAVCGSGNVPIDVTYLDSGTLGYMQTAISIRMDVSQLDRTASDADPPMIIITGTESAQANLVAVMMIQGAVEYEIESSFASWMQRILMEVVWGFQNLYTVTMSGLENLMFEIQDLGDRISGFFSNLKSFLADRFQEVVTAIKGDPSSAEDFNDELDDTLGEMKDIQNELDQATQPDIESQLGNIDTTISNEASGFMGSLFEIFISNNIFSTVLFFSVTLALVSYVFYGKR